MGGRVFDILLWTVVGAMFLALLLNAKDAGQLLATGFQGWNSTLQILTGATQPRAA